MRTVVLLLVSVVLAGITAAAFSACDRKIPQCNRLIQVINSEQEKVRDRPATDPAALRKLAESLSSISKKVAAVELEDAELLRMRDEYATMTDELAKAAGDTAKALEANDYELADKSNEQLETVGKREGPLVAELNKYCSGG